MELQVAELPCSKTKAMRTMLSTCGCPKAQTLDQKLLRQLLEATDLSSGTPGVMFIKERSRKSKLMANGWKEIMLIHVSRAYALCHPLAPPIELSLRPSVWPELLLM